MSSLCAPSLRGRDRRAPLRHVLVCIAMMAAGMGLGGCASAVVGAGATGAVAAAQERGLDGAIVDSRIRTEINYAWIEYDKELFAALNLNVYEGRVLVTGIAKSEKDRNEAVARVWKVRGVREVINEIIVDPSGKTGTFASDTWIAAQLRSEILFDRDVNAINYSIEAVRGTVYLFGVAQNKAELDRVITRARNINNVTRVVNHVLLKNDAKRA